MKVIETSIVIQSPAENVWTILTDLDSYVNWNPFIVFARGHLAVGQPIRLTRSADKSIGFWHGRVTVMNTEDHTLSWTTRWITAKLLKTVYRFRIEPIDTESSNFIQRETMSGFIPLILRQAWFHTLHSDMVSKNKAIKRLAENKRHRLPRLRISAR